VCFCNIFYEIKYLKSLVEYDFMNTINSFFNLQYKQVTPCIIYQTTRQGFSYYRLPDKDSVTTDYQTRIQLLQTTRQGFSYYRLPDKDSVTTDY